MYDCDVLELVVTVALCEAETDFERPGADKLGVVRTECDAATRRFFVSVGVGTSEFDKLGFRDDDATSDADFFVLLVDDVRDGVTEKDMLSSSVSVTVTSSDSDSVCSFDNVTVPERETVSDSDSEFDNETETEFDTESEFDVDVV